jgi:Co/Zn/Cd efflux system component
MECPSEERMIRMKLEELNGIHSLQFDIPGRKLEVYHTDSGDKIYNALDSLQLHTQFVSSEVTKPATISDDQHQESRVLWQVLIINIFFFALEIITGFIAGSIGLVADSLDMLADSMVYGLALFAVGSQISRKKKVAGFAGYFQLTLSILDLRSCQAFLGAWRKSGLSHVIVISLMALVGMQVVCICFKVQKTGSSHESKHDKPVK